MGQGRVGPTPPADGILSPNLFRLTPAGQWSLYTRKRRKGVHLCVCQVQSSLLSGGRGAIVSKMSVRVCPETPQLFSKSDRRSSLLLLGRSGGSRYDSSSSGLASSGRSCEEKNTQDSARWFQMSHRPKPFQRCSGLTSNDGSGMSEPAWLSKLLEEGLKDRSPW